MLLPIIDAIIQDVNRLAGDMNAPGFEEDLGSCIFVMENETNPDTLGYKFLMLEISLYNLHKILTYFSALQLRADSLQVPGGEPINKTALILAIKALTIAIEKEGEPLELSWKKVKNQSNRPELKDLISSVENTSPSNLPRPSTSTSNASASTIKASKRSSTKSNSKGTGAKTIAVEVPGTSQQIKIKHCSATSDSNPSDDSSPVKQMSQLAPPKAKAVRPAGRKGRHPSISSVSSVTPSSSPFSPTSPFSPPQLSPRTPLPQLEPLLDPALLSPESRRVAPSSSLSPSTSTRTPLPLLEPILEPSLLGADTGQGAISLSASTSSATSSTVPTYGLIVTFVVPVSIPIQQGLVRVLDPYRNKIETTPICGNHIFIKLKDKKDIYFLKRQIEILTRLSPRIVVTTFWRYQIEVIKRLSPTIKEFVNFNTPTLKGEFYVYSRALSQDCDNIIVFEVLADAQCRRSLENASYQLRIGEETRTAVLVDFYQECNRCFFCYDDAHSECSNAVLMTEDD